jgi:imidazolonepropionase-like amidohydrolase
MAEGGMSYRDILASLTTTPARRRGLGSSSGRVAPGFEADFTVLRGDPARTVDAFADVAYAIRGGRIIYQVAEKARNLR